MKVVDRGGRTATAASGASGALDPREALAVAARSRRGHEPWVFYPREGRWRWWSFDRGWTEVERWRAALAGGEHTPIETAPPPESSPQALCYHLAAARPENAGPSLAIFDRLLAPRPEAREIVVVTPPADDAPAPTDGLARLWLEWCCANLAVLVLEPSRNALVGSVLWCRPTTLLVDAAQERALAEAVWDRSRGRERKAAALVDRLRILLVAGVEGEAGGSAGPADRWRAWGVERRLVRR